MGETSPRHTDPQPTPNGSRDRRRNERGRGRRIAPAVGWALLVATAGILIAVTSSPEPVGGLAPPAGRFAHGAAGTARNGFGGEIAASPTIHSWPGSASSGNGGPFAFVGAQYGSLWGLPAAPNNRRGVGYCVMEDVRGEGPVSRRADPDEWSVGEMARAAALMSTFGGDRVVPYGIHARPGESIGPYDVASGEWQHPLLRGGGEYTRRRHVAVNFGMRMFLEDVSPTGAARGRKLARDSAVVDGSGGEFSALRNGYLVARRMASVAEVQAAVGGLQLELHWLTPGGATPTRPGRYGLEVRVRDGAGDPVGWVPVFQLSSTGIDGARSSATTATAIGAPSAAERVRYDASVAAGWPTWNMGKRLVTDPRFAVATDPEAAALANRGGIARFDVDITASAWEIGFHAQAPTDDVTLYTGTGIQGQVTWTGRPQSASVGQAFTPPPAPTTTDTTTVPPATTSTTAVATTSTTATTPPPATPPTTEPSATVPSATVPSTTAPPATVPPTAAPVPSTTPPSAPPTPAPTTVTASGAAPAITSGTTPTADTTPMASTPASTTSPDGPRASSPELPRTGRSSGRLAWWAAVVLLTGVGVLLNILRPDADHPM